MFARDGSMTLVARAFALGVAAAATICAAEPPRARDPGVQARAAVGSVLPGLRPEELRLFEGGKFEFLEAEVVGDGLGPRMNLDSCAGCHAQPAAGGSSPRVNPQIAFANRNAAHNKLPPFTVQDGPVRIARFLKNADGRPQGEVQPLFTITGQGDAPAHCVVRQPDFAAALAERNIALRIPTPVFGAGLIEQISREAILKNQAADAAAKRALGIAGRMNLGRFGWKAQHATLLEAGAEAYRTEMGITNELFPVDYNDTPACEMLAGSPEVMAPDWTPAVDALRRYRNPAGHRYLVEMSELRERLTAFEQRYPAGAAPLIDAKQLPPLETLSSIEKFALFMRYLAPPPPSSDTPGGAASISKGKRAFAEVGCAACHTPTLQTGDTREAALRNQPANLYSDLLVHDMGPGLADGVTQGTAGPSEFRTAPLWGLGGRLFLLHDGRTRDLREAIAAHASTRGTHASSANLVIDNYSRLPEDEKQDLLNFLRSL
jgi:CxxC motif-containing protein (DUF1111 family)